MLPGVWSSPSGPCAAHGASPVRDVQPQSTGPGVTAEGAAPTGLRLEMERLRLLQTVTAALMQAVTAADVKAIILKQGVPAAAASTGRLIKVVDAETLYSVETVGDDQTVEATWQRVPADAGGPEVAAIQAAQPIFATLDDLHRQYAALVPSPRTRAVAALPLMAGGQVLACLTLSFEYEADIGPGRRVHLLALAEVCSQALQRGRQYDEERDAHQRAVLLAEAGTALAESLDVKTTLERITALAIQHVADWAAVYLPDATGRMVAVAAAHPDPEQVKLLHWFLAQAPHDPEAPASPAWVLRTGHPVLVPVVPPGIVDAMPESGLRDAFYAMGLHSVMNVPLTV